MTRQLLVPLDGSPLAESSLRHGVALAQAYSAQLKLLRVLEDGSAAADSVEWRLRRAQARAYLTNLRNQLKDVGVTATIQVKEGKVAESLIAACARDRIDIVILTTHGRGGTSPVSVSGTASKLIAHGGISVMTVPSPWSNAGPEFGAGYSKVLAAVDCSQRSEWALRQAADIARANHAELVLAHIVDIPEVIGYGLPPNPEDLELRSRLVQRNRLGAERCLDSMLSGLPSRDRIRIRLEESAQVARKLDKIIADEAPDLVVLCAHGAGLDSGQSMPWSYGSVAQSLLGNLRRPTLVLQDLSRSVAGKSGTKLPEEAPPRVHEARADVA